MWFQADVLEAQGTQRQCSSGCELQPISQSAGLCRRLDQGKALWLQAELLEALATLRQLQRTASHEEEGVAATSAQLAEAQAQVEQQEARIAVLEAEAAQGQAALAAAQAELARQGAEMESLRWARLGLIKLACNPVGSSKWWWTCSGLECCQNVRGR